MHGTRSRAALGAQSRIGDSLPSRGCARVGAVWCEWLCGCWCGCLFRRAAREVEWYHGRQEGPKNSGLLPTAHSKLQAQGHGAEGTAWRRGWLCLPCGEVLASTVGLCETTANFFAYRWMMLLLLLLSREEAAPTTYFDEPDLHADTLLYLIYRLIIALSCFFPIPVGRCRLVCPWPYWTRGPGVDTHTLTDCGYVL